MSGFGARQLDRACYVLMRASLLVGVVVTRLAGSVAGILGKGRASRDLAILPYSPPGYPGYDVRIGNHLPFLDRDGVTYQVFAAATAAEVYSLESKPRFGRYLFYARVYWRRLVQVLRAARYRVAFVQRGLFPHYPDQRVPHLEWLLRRLVARSVIDFYDADYVPSPIIVDASVRYFDRVTVVGSHIEEHFRRLHADVGVFPLSVRIQDYAEKRTYAAGRPARILWMGSTGNASRLKLVEGVLQDVARRESVRLVLVCRQPVEVQGIDVEWVPWSERVNQEVMPSCDFAIYPATDTEADRGKMALKVLEYMAVGLPVVAVPYGLAPCVVHGENALVAEGEDAWVEALSLLLHDEVLRERLGRNARQAVDTHHSPAVVYGQFSRLVFGRG